MLPISALDHAAETFARLASLGPPEALERLHAIALALPSCDAPERVSAIASALPRRVEALAPEVGLALAELALSLAHHGPRIPERLDALAPRLQVEWLRVQLTAGAIELDSFSGIDESLLLRALTGWSPLEVGDPSALFEAMTRARDPRLRIRALGLVRAAVDELAITAELAQTCLLRLTRDEAPSVRRAAFAGLVASGSVRVAPRLEAERERVVRAGLDDDDDEVANACVTLARDAGARAWLVEVGFDPSRSGPRREAAITALGPLASAEDLEPSLALACADPLRFGACVRVFLLEAHRRGVFVRAAAIPDLLAAFDAHEGWTGELLVRVAHIARAALIAALAELPADDRRGIRRAAILAASVDTGAHALIAERLRATTDTRIAIALVEAAGRSPEFDDEAALLAWLERIPEPVIAALRVKGGEASIARLRAKIEDPSCPTRLRSAANEALWALSRDRSTLLRELCERLGPHEAGLLEPSRRAARDDRAAAILGDAPWLTGSVHAIDPLVALRVLCESGSVAALPEITRRFRAIFSDYVAEALAGDFTIKRVRMPALEQLIYRYGRTLIADARCVRRWIDDAPDTGRELVLALAIDWLREHPSAPICVALLETIGRHEPSGASLRQIEAFWRERDPEVQRAALEAIVAAGEGARGLERSIGRLSNASDPRVLRQALLGVASLAARWAEPMVIAALAHPEMGIKKEAAAALVEVGSLRCVPALIDWLARHDNPGFRTQLLAALRAVLDRGAAASLIDAIEASEDRRARGLLREALSGMLSLRALLRLARSQRPVRLELVEAALAGELGLADASPEALAAALHRAKLRRATKVEDPARRLRLEGFGAEAAIELLEARTHAKSSRDNAAILAIVRASLVEWLRWLGGDPTPEQAAAALDLVLEATTPEQTREPELLDAILGATEARCEALEPGVVADFLERCLAPAQVGLGLRSRGLAILRRLALDPSVGGLRRYGLLGKLGALREREDLCACLDACKLGPTLAAESEQLLGLAFAIPKPSADEVQQLGVSAAAALDELREQAKRWYRLDTAAAEAWIDAMLEARPLDSPALELPPRPEAERPKPSALPRSREDLDALLARVRGESSSDPHERSLAAARILAWPDARHVDDAWARVLAAYLAGEVQLDATSLSTLARTLEAWPTDARAAVWSRARALIPGFDTQQRRSFLPAWIAAWERGEAGAEALLRSLDEDLLLPEASARMELGDPSLFRLLAAKLVADPTTPLRPSLAMRSAIELVGARAPDEVAALLERLHAAEPAQAKPLVDPIAERSLDDLVALIRDRKVDEGLAVRAIHALTRFEERGADAIEPFTLDRRPKLRSAALRALRRVAPRERSLAASVALLEVETRRDVIVSLIASIAHGHYEPGLPRLLGYLVDTDAKLRDAAEQALLAWGSAIVPELHRAARKARPDRRPIFERMLATLESETQ